MNKTATTLRLGDTTSLTEVKWAPAEELLDQLGRRLFATVPEVAAVVRVEERTLRRAIEAGTFPGVRIGTCIRIPVAALLALANGSSAEIEAA